MTLERGGAVAALVCAGTYLFGFALLTTILAPLSYGTNDIDPHAVVAFIGRKPGVLTMWNTAIYIVNALALVVLVVALSAHLEASNRQWACVCQAFGLIWATLVLGAGMIANTAVEVAAAGVAVNATQTVQTWAILHAVELGLGGGNEIAGGAWVMCVSLAGGTGHGINRMARYAGIVTGVAGLVTIIPMYGRFAGEVFGLGAIIWFVAVAWGLFRSMNGTRFQSIM